MRALLAASVALFALAGCAPTIQQVRVSGPVQQADLPRNYKDLAGCVTHATVGKYPVTDAILESDGLATVTSVEDYQGYKLPQWEISIKRIDDSHSHVEVRAATYALGSAMPSGLWQTIQTCGTSAA